MQIFFAIFALTCSNAETLKASLTGYMQANYDADARPDENVWGSFNYTRLHLLLPEKDNDRHFNSGLFHTWYTAGENGSGALKKAQETAITNEIEAPKKGYTTMEGGIGYKPYSSFINSKIPLKFAMGGVSNGFGHIGGNPSQGSPHQARRDGWDENLGRYASAQLSNQILSPLDSINVTEDSIDKMFGYGYYALPLTDAKATTAGTNVPTGDKCWTLFFNTKNFKGPVAFFNPYFWSKRTIDFPHIHGDSLDSTTLKKKGLS